MTVLGHFWRRLPLQVLYYRSHAMRRLVAESLDSERFDAAYVHLFRMAPYVRPGGVPYRIVDLTDVISNEVARSLPFRRLPGRALWAFERRRIELFEREMAHAGDEIWLISRTERDQLLQRAPGANAHVIPNGVDIDTFRPLEVAADPRRIMFSGHLGVPHNIDAAVWLTGAILPAIQRSVPGCRLRIVGSAPSAKVQRLARRHGVEVTGFVPDLNLELNQAAVFVAPLRFSAGVQNKVLEAMAAARPVVTTPEIAAGLEAVTGRHLLVGDGSEELAAHAVSLLTDPDRRRALGTAARAFVADRFSWRFVAERMREIADSIKVRV